MAPKGTDLSKAKVQIEFEGGPFKIKGDPLEKLLK
jgi:hypothetical protein